MSGRGALRVVRADNPSPMTLDGTRTWVVGRQRPVVIDPGPADEGHLRAIEAALGGARPLAILLTHAHPDHAAAAPALAERTGAPVWMARGALHPAPPGLVVGRWIGDGAEVETDAGTLRAVSTPGHAPEHLAYWWTGRGAPERGAGFVGDLLMGEGDTTLVAPPEGNLAEYLRSLDRIGALDAEVLYPAHGEPLHDPRGAVARYREHRAARIEQVRRVLARLPGASVAALVDEVYGAGLHPGLREAAEGSMRAVLHYLEETDESD